MSSDMMNATGPIPEFLDKVSKNWGLSFVYPKIWAITFECSKGNYNLGQSIKSVLARYRDINNFESLFTTANPYSDILKTPKNCSVSVGDASHFLLANKISIPGESIQLSTGAIPSANESGGILWGRALASKVSNPSSATKLKITFFDTNKEIIDLLIKPWLAAISYQGLIEDPNCKPLKCNITAYFFAKSSANGHVIKDIDYSITRNEPAYITEANAIWDKVTDTVKVSSYSENKPFLRKQITFMNCVPVNIPEKHYNFGNDVNLDEIMSEVNFSYDYYTIIDKSAEQK